MISVEAFNALIERESAFSVWLGLRLESVEPGRAVVRVPFSERLLRPGGVVHGPALMAAGDFAMYAVAMSIWERGENAVSANLNMSFLRRTTEEDLLCTASVLRSGRRLAFMEAAVRAGDETDAVFHMTGTYAVPTETV